MLIRHIITLLQFCFKSTYFLFQDKYYEQVHGAAMGHPLIQAINTGTNPPKLWKSYLCNSKTEQWTHFLEHINSNDSHIFTTDDPIQVDQCLPGITCYTMTRQHTAYNSLQKNLPTQTITCIGIAATFQLSTVCLTPSHTEQGLFVHLHLLQEEGEHTREAHQKCKFPNWALNRLKIKKEPEVQHEQPLKKQAKDNKDNNMHMVLP